jgi:hypothetical protein
LGPSQLSLAHEVGDSPEGYRQFHGLDGFPNPTWVSPSAPPQALFRRPLRGLKKRTFKPRSQVISPPPAVLKEFFSTGMKISAKFCPVVSHYVLKLVLVAEIAATSEDSYGST